MGKSINAVRTFSPAGVAYDENQTFEPLAADPTGVGLWGGRHWYNTTDNLAKYYNGTAVVPYPAMAAAQTPVFTESPTGVALSIGGGTPDSIGLADATNAGVMSPAHFTKLENLSNIAGQHIDTVATSAALDALTDVDGSAALESGDWAILSVDEGGRQAGIYVHNATAWPAAPAYVFPDTFTAATETVAGVAQIATTVQVAAGTDDTAFVTSLKLAQLNAARGGNEVIGDGTVGPFVFAHGVTLSVTAPRLHIQVFDANGEVDVTAVNDATNITVTPVAAVATNEYTVVYSRAD